MYEHIGNADNLDSAITWFIVASELSDASLLEHTYAGRECVRLLTKVSRFEEAAEIIDSTVRIVSRVSPRPIQWEDQQYALGKVRGLALVATSIVLQSGKPASYALELLEIGCGVIAGLLVNFASDISTLAKEHLHIQAAPERSWIDSSDGIDRSSG